MKGHHIFCYKFKLADINIRIEGNRNLVQIGISVYS